MKRIRLGLLVGVLAGAASCQAARETSPPLVDETGPAPVAFRRRIDQEGSLIFRSWDGRWIGTDCDVDLQFLPGGRITLIEYGEGVFRYRGTYRLEDDGTLEASLEGAPGPWPVMLLDRDTQCLRLRPKTRVQGHWLGSREGGFWTFRHVPRDPEGNRFHD